MKKIIVILTTIFLFFACSQEKTKQAVLILEITQNASESHGIDKFKQALNNGGQLTISINEITSEWYNFESKYSISKNGSYVIRGAVINFVCQDYGWRYYGSEMSNIVFVKEIKIEE